MTICSLCKQERKAEDLEVLNASLVGSPSREPKLPDEAKTLPQLHGGAGSHIESVDLGRAEAEADQGRVEQPEDGTNKYLESVGSSAPRGSMDSRAGGGAGDHLGEHGEAGPKRHATPTVPQANATDALQDKPSETPESQEPQPPSVMQTKH